MEAITASLQEVQRLRREKAAAIEESKIAPAALHMIKECKMDKRKFETKARPCTREYLNAKKARNPRLENENAKEYKTEEQKGVKRPRNSEENKENTDTKRSGSSSIRQRREIAPFQELELGHFNARN
ncbi:hypothetical protein BDD12DRAFT_811072 [Trichophaea hybrida]|nr:hypothetical protein BDD12DRAFT_811072 [Trichophaea hybrida]